MLGSLQAALDDCNKALQSEPNDDAAYDSRGLIHLKINPITAAAAFVLGLFSGELRHRSGSLLPAILVHAVFNAFAAIL